MAAYSTASTVLRGGVISNGSSLLCYRNPEFDVPQDFEENKEYYYGIINQPLSSEEFIDTIQKKLTDSVKHFETRNQLDTTSSLMIMQP